MESELEINENHNAENLEKNDEFENNDQLEDINPTIINLPIPKKVPLNWIDEYSDKLAAAMEEDNVSKKNKKLALEHVENLKRAFFPELFLNEEANSGSEEEEEAESDDASEKAASPRAIIEDQKKAIKEFQDRCKRLLQRSRFNQTIRSILGSLIVAAFMFVFVAIVGFTIGLLAGGWLGPAAFFAALAAGSAAAVSVITVAAVVASVSAAATAWFMFKQPHPSTLKVIKSLKHPEQENKEDKDKPKPHSTEEIDNSSNSNQPDEEDLEDYDYTKSHRSPISKP